jgi:hypothetical protein
VYSTELLDHFENPRNAGTVKAPDCSAQLENPVCGDILELSLSLEGDMSEGSKQSRRIGDIRFRAKGCVPTLACGSAITELAKGKTVAEACRPHLPTPAILPWTPWPLSCAISDGYELRNRQESFQLRFGMLLDMD